MVKGYVSRLLYQFIPPSPSPLVSITLFLRKQSSLDVISRIAFTVKSGHRLYHHSFLLPLTTREEKTFRGSSQPTSTSKKTKVLSNRGSNKCFQLRHLPLSSALSCWSYFWAPKLHPSIFSCLLYFVYRSRETDKTFKGRVIRAIILFVTTEN